MHTHIFYFKEADQHEKSGDLDKALSTLLSARRDPEMHGLNKVIAANIHRILLKSENLARRKLSDVRPTPIIEHDKNPTTYCKALDPAGSILAPVVSLTTISSRIGRIERTIDSIKSQTRTPHSINLYVSSEPFLVDKGIKSKDPILRKLGEKGVNIYNVSNIGPYRKQIPVILQLREAGAPPSTPIITIDDDVIYPPEIIERLMSCFNGDHTVVAHRGREINFENGGLASYRSFCPPKEKLSVLNVGTGKNGIAYRLRHFPTDPGDFIGPVLAPTADDLWCKWITAIYCIPTRILEPNAAYDPSLDFEESEPTDKNGLFHKYNAKGMNDNAMFNLEEFFSSRRVGLSKLFSGVNRG